MQPFHVSVTVLNQLCSCRIDRYVPFSVTVHMNNFLFSTTEKPQMSQLSSTLVFFPRTYISECRLRNAEIQVLERLFTFSLFLPQCLESSRWRINVSMSLSLLGIPASVRRFT